MSITHSELVKALVKPAINIVHNFTEKDAGLIHMAVGIAGESGELLDAIKKVVIYKKPIDINHVIEELGDLEFYMEGLRQELGLNRDDILKANIEKLSVRYNGLKYSDDAAKNRADKV